MKCLGLTSYLSVETGWFLFPFYMIFTVVIMMIILIGHMLLFDDMSGQFNNVTQPTFAKGEL